MTKKLSLEILADENQKFVGKR